MGMNFLARNSTSTEARPSFVQRPLNNPNPHNFTVARVYRKDDLWVSLIHYPDCNNFEGQKIIVSRKDPRDCSVFDPHFTRNGYIVARFEPTASGWNLAVKMLDLM